jgi:hypothetical protein
MPSLCCVVPLLRLQMRLVIEMGLPRLGVRAYVCKAEPRRLVAFRITSHKILCLYWNNGLLSREGTEMPTYMFSSLNIFHAS